MFHIIKNPKPAGDQPNAIKALVSNFKNGSEAQTLLGVTGSGKTFTMAHTIQKLGVPALIISHNKTLAAQLYEEFKALFPKDNVHYFVSYYDYYQPEAYMPTSDTYIEKEVKINEEIDMMRHAAVRSLLQHTNTIVIASVSCIYNLGSPETFQQLALQLKIGQEMTTRQLLKHLLTLQFERNEYDFWRGKFRQRDKYIDVWPPGGDTIIRIHIAGGVIKELKTMEAPFGTEESITTTKLFPAKFWPAEEGIKDIAASNIRLDLQQQLKKLEQQKKFIEAERLRRRTNYDLALIEEVGWCHGIENYSRYFEHRDAGAPPFTLIDYYPDDFLTIIDESHMTIPQIQGMYHGDRARKGNLIEHGFRLPSALDNRPLTGNEFEKHIKKTLYVSATPAAYEKNISSHIVEQLVRPTHLLDPTIEVRSTKGQIPNLIKEIENRIAKKERVLVTVLTKRLAEALSQHLKDKKIKSEYLHSEIDTLERPKILRDFRNGKFDVIVGINLLREGLDLPEVSLVVILDADKEGFLRDRTSFIQIAGRASRHIEGHVIMYADKITSSMKTAIGEMQRRRKTQEEYNTTHHTTPTPITKPVIFTLQEEKEEEFSAQDVKEEFKRDYIKELTKKMELAQRNLQFEKAAHYKQQLSTLKKKNPQSQ